LGKIISKKEWNKYKDNFFWIRHETLIRNNTGLNNETLKEILLKWCEKNIKGWVYFSQDFWMFEFKEDASKLKSLILMGYFDEGMGEVNGEG
jgi:hypothetical protein